jgi:hypothetical protein
MMAATYKREGEEEYTELQRDYQWTTLTSDAERGNFKALADFVLARDANRRGRESHLQEEITALRAEMERRNAAVRELQAERDVLKVEVRKALDWRNEGPVLKEPK